MKRITKRQSYLMHAQYKINRATKTAHLVRGLPRIKER